MYSGRRDRLDAGGGASPTLLWERVEATLDAVATWAFEMVAECISPMHRTETRSSSCEFEAMLPASAAAPWRHSDTRWLVRASSRSERAGTHAPSPSPSRRQTSRAAIGQQTSEIAWLNQAASTRAGAEKQHE